VNRAKGISKWNITMEHISCPEGARKFGRERLPDRRGSLSYQFEHSGFTFTATVSKFADGRLAEIFLDYERPNSQLQEHAADSAVLASLLLQHGVTVAAIRHSISGPLLTALKLAEGST
jgi:hypothetical protein